MAPDAPAPIYVIVSAGQVLRMVITHGCGYHLSGFRVNFGQPRSSTYPLPSLLSISFPLRFLSLPPLLLCSLFSSSPPSSPFTLLSVSPPLRFPSIRFPSYPFPLLSVSPPMRFPSYAFPLLCVSPPSVSPRIRFPSYPFPLVSVSPPIRFPSYPFPLVSVSPPIRFPSYRHPDDALVILAACPSIRVLGRHCHVIQPLCDCIARGHQTRPFFRAPQHRSQPHHFEIASFAIPVACSLRHCFFHTSSSSSSSSPSTLPPLACFSFLAETGWQECNAEQRRGQSGVGSRVGGGGLDVRGGGEEARADQHGAAGRDP
ncbi:unnamed protein product [Closterium sp. Naga37s-1]|nr:unnamed protein product [Closterium sp. Naga37s-1]